MTLSWWKWFLTEAFNSYLRVDAFGLAKQVAFSVVFALLPTLFVLMSIAALAERFLSVPVTSEVRDEIGHRAPPETQEFLLDLVDQAITDTSATTLSISGLVALGMAIWAGTSGTNALIEATNRACGVRNTRSWPEKRVMAVVMLVALTFTIVISVIGTFFGERVISSLSDRTGEPAWLQRFGTTVQAVVSVLIVFAVITLLYLVSPAVEQSLRWVIPGALLTTTAWLILLSVFGYIANRLDFSSIYGAASGFMLLLYVLNFAGGIVIVGAIVNGVLGQRYDTRRRRDLIQHPWKIRYVQTGQEVAAPPMTLSIPRPWKARTPAD